jgi:N-acetyltransferase
MWKELFELTGDTVKLVPMSEKHLSELWEAAKPEQIWSYTYSKVRSLEEMKKMVESAMKDREQGVAYPFVVVDKETGSILGSTRYLDILPAHKSVEIGWTWYNPSVWRTRVNTECKYLLLQHAFECWEFNRVQIKTDSRNERSQKAIERIGAVKEGILRKDRIIEDGYNRSTVMYSILKEEWPAVKQLLNRKLSNG